MSIWNHPLSYPGFALLGALLGGWLGAWVAAKQHGGTPGEPLRALLRLAILWGHVAVHALLNKSLTHAALKRAISWVPGHKLRKRLNKLLIEEEHHAAELRMAGRPRVAKWIELCTWGIAVWYVVVAPLATLWSLLQGQSGAAK